MLATKSTPCDARRPEHRAREYMRHAELERSASSAFWREIVEKRTLPKPTVRDAAKAFARKRKNRRIFVYYPTIGSLNRAAKFSRLAEEWRRDTRFHSSLSKKFMHPAYQTIMAMGEPALPLILKDLEKTPGHWFYALRFIAQKDVAEHAQGFEDARNIWLEWGRENHFI